MTIQTFVNKVMPLLFNMLPKLVIAFLPKNKCLLILWLQSPFAEGPEKICEEIIAENFPNMGKEIVNQVQEAQRVPGRMNPRRNTLRQSVIKPTKIKDKDKKY